MSGLRSDMSVWRSFVSGYKEEARAGCAYWRAGWVCVGGRAA